jgi:hypothetical protein
MHTKTLDAVRSASCVMAVALACVVAPARAVDTNRGHVQARAWTPILAEASDQVSSSGGALGLSPLAVAAGAHPRDAQLTTQAQASLEFDRPRGGDATYRSFAGAWGQYASASYMKQASTSFVLQGMLRLDALDVLEHLLHLPNTLDLRLQVVSALTGQLVATGFGGTARTGLNLDWQVSGMQHTGSLALTSQYMQSEPLVQASGLFSDAQDWTRRSFSSTDLNAMFGAPPMGSSGGAGVSLHSIDVIDLQARFTAYNDPSLGIPVWYETPLYFAIDTYADLGTGEWTFGATDLRNTLHFDFALLDASGRPLDLPVDLVLSNVPEPASALLLALGLALTGAAARRRTRQEAAPAA